MPQATLIIDLDQFQSHISRIFIYIYLKREREREGESEGSRERERLIQ